ncbi:MAG TPA: peptidase [Actinobacteria bacterium]|nr:peptidase [Actinomycetota bacterium]
MATASGYYRHPTICGERIVFVSEDDLWMVASGGGIARRLTASPGTITFPRFSPDGAQVAFTARDEGHPEAYVMDADGGPLRRLTWMGSLTQVVGWTPDGARVIVASDFQQPFAGAMQLHTVPMDGGASEPMNVGVARAISFQPGGPGVVLGRNTYDPARWKRYRGGTAGTLWIDRDGDGTFVKLIDLPGNVASPMWVRSRIYFISDHEGVGNLYSCTPTGRNLQRHTDHEDFYARFASTDRRRLVYHAGADLWLYDVRSGDNRRLGVDVPGSRSRRNRKFISPGGYLERIDLHPQGHSLVATARGGVTAMPLWEGVPARHGTASAVRYRLASWLPDGDRIVATTDEHGDEELIVFSAAAPAKVLKVDVGRLDSLLVAPGGDDRVALTNQRQEMLIVHLTTGDVTNVYHSPYERIQGTAWSADGRWLAFAAFVSSRNSSLFLYDTETGKLSQVTRPDFVDVRPSFDPKGKFLYFISMRVYDPVYDSLYFDLGFPKGMRPHLITLSASDVSPFSAVTRPPRAPGEADGAETAKGAKPDKEAGPTPVTVDLLGIEDRVVAFPVPEGRYQRVHGAEQRILFSSHPIEGSLDSRWSDTEEKPKSKLEAYDLKQDKVETVMEGISDFSVSADGKVLGIRVAQKLRVVPVSFKDADGKSAEPGRESGWVDLDRIRLEVVPGDEWQQMFREAWRLQRDQFWRPNMSGVDWEAVAERYLPLVDRVGSRAEFSDLMWEMQGELGTSHAYELGGDYQPEPQWLQGFLGADLHFDGRVWKIERIPRGDSWQSDAASPLSAPGLDIKAGDRLVAIEGTTVDTRTSPYAALVDRAGRPVTLTVRRGRRKAHTVIVETLQNEFGLRYRDWVEANRERIHSETDGRVGYVHIPDMGPRGYAEFHRYYGAEVNHEGLIIDVRNNRGGHVSQLLLEKLRRRRIGYDFTRYGQPESYPVDAPMGPMVALTDEHSGSDGDSFSHSFKLFGLGPLIGKRTWGGVVGIFPRHALVDGTITTQPEFSFWFEDVGWGVENHGTDPDIEVEITPQDHAAGRDPQLDRAIKEILEIVQEQQPGLPVFPEPPSRRPPVLSR